MTSNTSVVEENKQQWSGQFGFIISAIGSAVGLGNIWRFPGVAYENGGGAFLIPYIIALLTVGLPILFLDYAIGHRFRGSSPISFARIRRKFEVFGWFQNAICFFITLYYAAIVAWALSYFFFSFNLSWGEDTATFLSQYLGKTAEPGFSLVPQWSVFIPLLILWVSVIVVLALGVAKGVEKANIIFMPVLAISFGALVLRALFLPGAVDGLNMFFTPDFAALLDPGVWIAAYSQIFYSLSIGFGIMVTYAQYRKRKSNQTGAGLIVGFANSSFELLAGIGVFAILGFMAKTEGPESIQSIKGIGLAFITFPKAVSAMPGASIVGCLFFGSLVMAGFTSVLSLMQVISSGFQDKFKLSARKAALVGGIPAALLSLFMFGTTTGFYTLDVFDHWACDIGTIICGFFTVVLTILVARKGPEFAYHLSVLSTFKVGRLWRFIVTAFTPLMLGYIGLIECWKLVTVGYPGYSFGYQFLFGWMILILSIVYGIVMFNFRKLETTKLINNFTPWPSFPPVSKGVQK